MGTNEKTLQYIKYTSYGYPPPTREIVLNFSEGMINYEYGIPEQEPECKGSYEDWKDEIRIQIETTLGTFKKRVYRNPPEVVILDGEYWELEFMYQGEEKPHIKRGNNAYPSLWRFLMLIFNDVAGDWFWPKKWYTYYSVMINDRNREYYYLALEGDEYSVGDKVEVPFGSIFLEGEITRIEKFPEDVLPLSLEKMKYILGKC
jgi:hypothetical protein